MPLSAAIRLGTPLQFSCKICHCQSPRKGNIVFFYKLALFQKYYRIRQSLGIQTVIIIVIVMVIIINHSSSKPA